MCAINFSMVRTSRTGGMRSSVTRSEVSRQAASAGRAEFFAPLTAISPSSGTPPWIRNLSTLFESLRNASAGPREQTFRFGARDALLLHDDGRAHAAVRRIEQLRGTFVRHTRRLLDNAPGPIFQLL